MSTIKIHFLAEIGRPINPGRRTEAGGPHSEAAHAAAISSPVTAFFVP